MKLFLVLLALTAALLPIAGSACEPTADQMTDYFVRSRQAEESYIIYLARSADQIFTGVVIEVDDLKSGPYLQLAHIRVERMIKGQPLAEIRAMMNLRVKPQRGRWALDRVVACGELDDPAQTEPYVAKTYRHLYYVKSGILLRANGFPLGPPPLGPEQEIQLLQNHAPVLSPND